MSTDEVSHGLFEMYQQRAAQVRTNSESECWLAGGGGDLTKPAYDVLAVWTPGSEGTWLYDNIPKATQTTMPAVML